MGSGNVEKEIEIIEVCKYMGWDYWTYLKQPIPIIYTVITKIRIENEMAQIEAKKLKLKHG